MKWLHFAMVSVLSAFASFAEVTRDTEWQDVPDATKVGTVLDLGGGGGGFNTNAVIDIANETIATNPVVSAKLDGPSVAPTNTAEAADKAADAKLTGIALTNRYTKAETDAKLAEKIGGGEVPSFEQDPTATEKAQAEILAQGLDKAVKTDESGSAHINGRFTAEGGLFAYFYCNVNNGNLSTDYQADCVYPGIFGPYYFPWATSYDLEDSDHKFALVSQIEDATNALAQTIPAPYVPSHTNATFAAEVLAVGLDIDADTLQWLKDIGAIAQSTTGQVGLGTLLAALLAALMWLKNNKVGQSEVDEAKAELNERIDLIEATSHPNMSIVGSPTFTEGVVSGFSANDYLMFPTDVNVGQNEVDFYMAFTTGANVTVQQNILDSWCGIAFAIKEGGTITAASQDGTTFVTATSAGTISANSSYRLKLEFRYSDGSYTVTTKLASGSGDYAQIGGVVTLTAPVHPTATYWGGANPTSGVNHIFGGSINLAECKMDWNGKTVWRGYTEVPTYQKGVRPDGSPVDQELHDFFKDTNSLLTGTIASETSEKAEKSELPIPLVAKTDDFTAESYKRFVVASMPSAGLTLTMHTPTGTDADVFECRFNGTALTADASVSFTGATVTKMEGETDTGVVKAGKVALMSAFWNGATWDVNWKVEG